MNKVLILLFTIIVLNSCNTEINESDLIGNYVAHNFENTSDTLKLLSNGKYKRIIYDIKKNKVIFSNSDKWNFNGKYLELDNFLPNNDNLKFGKENSDYKNRLLFQSFSVKNEYDGIKFLIFKDLNYYYTLAK